MNNTNILIAAAVLANRKKHINVIVKKEKKSLLASFFGFGKKTDDSKKVEERMKKAEGQKEDLSHDDKDQNLQKHDPNNTPPKKKKSNMKYYIVFSAILAIIAYKQSVAPSISSTPSSETSAKKENAPVDEVAKIEAFYQNGSSAAGENDKKQEEPKLEVDPAEEWRKSALLPLHSAQIDFAFEDKIYLIVNNFRYDHVTQNKITNDIVLKNIEIIKPDVPTLFPSIRITLAPSISNADESNQSNPLKTVEAIMDYPLENYLSLEFFHDSVVRYFNDKPKIIVPGQMIAPFIQLNSIKSENEKILVNMNFKQSMFGGEDFSFEYLVPSDPEKK